MRIGPTALRSILAAPLALLILAGSAFASDVVYPPGSRIGLVPLDGIVPLKNGAGFENPDNNLSVTLREMPPSAFDAIDTAMRERKPLPTAMEDAQAFETAAGRAYLSRAGGPNSGPNNGRVAIIVSDGRIAGYISVDVPEAAAKAYPDHAIRRMLASTMLRAEVPAEEQLELLPFKVSDLSGFKNVRTLVPGQAVMLLDGDEEGALSGAPYVLISVARVSADQPDGRERLARQLATTIPGLREGRITNSEPMRIGGAAGHEIRVEGTSIKDDKPVTVVQWLRFGGGATLRIIAASARKEWPQMFTRFRAVRDGIDRR
ncbi:hypothetical protein [Bradyrhizobium sp. LHD-71]|uniref:hypothetical protein n=1 Tax=Bradyrhizobium sp. LHD-71 TaxID=3072141 RepID=UPI0028101AA3|nr:hypothetical protein [Bradyrhizobium sp. LHD-71]MDQ8732205.1 hypothetical protein [Bradyrhizobium sp. LHD-71]